MNDLPGRETTFQLVRETTLYNTNRLREGLNCIASSHRLGRGKHLMMKPLIIVQIFKQRDWKDRAVNLTC